MLFVCQVHPKSSASFPTALFLASEDKLKLEQFYGHRTPESFCSLFASARYMHGTG